MPRTLSFKAEQPRSCQLCQTNSRNLARPQPITRHRLWFCNECLNDEERGLQLYAEKRLLRNSVLSSPNVELTEDEKNSCIDFFKITWRAMATIVHTQPEVEIIEHAEEHQIQEEAMNLIPHFEEILEPLNVEGQEQEVPVQAAVDQFDIFAPWPFQIESSNDSKNDSLAQFKKNFKKKKKNI